MSKQDPVIVDPRKTQFDEAQRKAEDNKADDIEPHDVPQIAIGKGQQKGMHDRDGKQQRESKS